MRWMLVLTSLLAMALVAQADLRLPDGPRRPPPKPANPEVVASFVIEIDPNATTPKLLVPRKIVKRNAGLDIPNDEWLTEADLEPRQPWTRTAFAGVSLALFASCTGLWLARRSRSGTGAALLLLGVMLAGGSAVVYANAPPPPPKPTALEQLYSGRINVVYVPEGDSVKLIVPSELARNFAKPGIAPNAPAKPE